MKTETKKYFDRAIAAIFSLIWQRMVQELLQHKKFSNALTQYNRLSTSMLSEVNNRSM